MKKLTKITAIVTATALAVTATAVFPVHPLGNTVYASQESAEHYFYYQLPDDAKVFYDAMEIMNEKGIFKTGNGDYDLIDNGHFSNEQAEAFAEGSTLTMKMFGAARDAFYADHADIFYVDFSKLSIRVTNDDEKYHIYLGSGRISDYYTEGFSNKEQVDKAVSEYDSAIGKIVDEAKKITAEEKENLTQKQIEFVHDYITNHVSYRLENACKPENTGFIRTAYGALVKGEGVCEGYSRAFKAVMDRLGIPCVLVNGVFRHSENVPELHMWCEVQIDNAWYAVDATMDDPKSKNGVNGVDGYENQNYMLVGESVISRQHVPSGIMSPAEFEFEYPALNPDSFNVKEVSNYNGLSVKYKSDGEFEDLEAGIFYVSYNGMGVAKSAEQGKYLLCKTSIYYEQTDEWDIGEWGYILPEIYPAITDTDTEVILPFPHINYVEFAVTDIAPPAYDKNTTSPDFSYHGDPMLFESYTGSIYNPSGSYVRAPVVSKITPSNSGRIYYGKTYHVVATYDDVLKLEDENVEPYYVLTATNAHNNGAGDSAEENSKIENFKWDGASTIEFDFTPSEMWLDDSVNYNFSIKGLIGSKSLKAPRDFAYYVCGQCAVCAYRSQGIQWNLFGKPSLMENFDVDTTDWQSASGEEIADELRSRMVLVVTEPTHSQTDEMLDMIEDESGEEILSQQTYNINLSICNLQVISTGDGVRIQLGFPEGYGPEDEGVTFKVYHFFKDESGNITGVEEIPCVITKYGLVIICKSFSPFAIVAVPEDEEKESDADKTVLLSATEGGEVKGAENIFTLSKGESKTLSITSQEGYVIDSVAVAGEYYAEANGKTKAEITVSYDDLAESNGIIDVKFVAKTVVEKDKGRNESVVLPHALPAEIEFEYDTQSVTVGENLVITPTVTSKTEGAVETYQWYKDGKLLEGQKSKDLTVQNADYADAGEYTLEVITASNATTAKAEGTVKVEVVDCKHVFGEWKIDKEATCTENGLEKRECTLCGFVEERETEAKGHVTEIQNKKDANCTEDGYTGDTVCTVCQEVIEKGTVIGALGHKTELKNQKEATCTETGYSGDEICTVCGETVSKGETLPMTEHKFVDGKCEVCGAEEPEEPSTDTSSDTEPSSPTNPPETDEPDNTDDNTTSSEPTDTDSDSENGGGNTNDNPNTANSLIQILILTAGAASLLFVSKKRS